MTIRLCGPLSLTVGDERRETPLRGRRRHLLFAFLVLHRDRPIRRDELLEAIASPDGVVPRPEVLPPVLSRLRVAIAPATLRGRGDVSLVLPLDTWIDVEAARSTLGDAQNVASSGDWSSALALAKHVEALTAPGLLPAYEAAWLATRRGAFDVMRVEALELAARAGERVGGAALPEAERFARAAVAASPFRESAHVALISVLQARGNAAEGLRAFEEVRVLLRDELGVSPGRELLALHERLLRPERTSATPLARVTPPRAALLEERSDELGELDKALAAAGSGNGQLIIIEGSAGVGKTRLLGELHRRADARGLRSLAVHAGPLEQAFAFGVVRQLLELVDAAGVLPDDDAEITSSVRAVLSDIAPTAGTGPGAFVVLHGILELVRRLARRQAVVLCVDDLHWCDRPSLRFLAYLARRLGDMNVVVAVTVRTGEPGGQEQEVRELVADPASLLVRPGPLSAAAVARLVTHSLGTPTDPAFAAACYQVTGGNPLLLCLLLSGLDAEGAVPDAEHVAVVKAIGLRAVSPMVLARLGRLSPDATTVARAVAILGQRAEMGAAAELAGLPERDAVTAAGVLVRTEVLRAEGGLEFVHPLVADAVYYDLSPPERDLAHRQAARMLADRTVGADRVAAHLLKVTPRQDSWVVDCLRLAARLALARGAPDSAVAYLGRALAEPPHPDCRPEVLLELGRAEVALQGRSAVEHLREAVDTLTEPGLRAAAVIELALALLYLGRAGEGQELALRACADLPEVLADQRDALQALAIYAMYFDAGRVVDVVESPPVARTTGTALLAGAVAVFECIARCSPETSIELARTALEVDALLDDDNPLWTGPVGVLTMADRFDEALMFYRRALVGGQRRGSLFMAQTVRAFEGCVYLRMGRLDAAQSLLVRAVDGLMEWGTGTPASASQPLAFLAETRIELDDLPGALAALDVVQAPVGASLGTRLLLAVRGEALLVLGRPTEALDIAERLAALPPLVQNPNAIYWRSLLARALANVGRHEAALGVAHEDLDHAVRWGAPSAIGRTLRVLGELQGDDGLSQLRRAVGTLETSPARLEYAKALAALGAASVEPDRTRLLQDALAEAGRCGALRLARHVRTLLGDAVHASSCAAAP